MRYLGGHLGTAVSALVDGQLDPHSADRAWTHVHGCAVCTRQVEHEGWVKRRLTAMSGQPSPASPPERLLGSLYDLSSGSEPVVQLEDARTAWRTVNELERRERGRRRTGLAVVGAGSVSAAVLGFASLTGPPLGIAGAPTAPPSTAVTSPGAPPVSTTATISSTVQVHGRLPSGVPALFRSAGGAPPSDARSTGNGLSPSDLRR